MSQAAEVSRVERRKARTRAALIEAAQRIFAERGVADASIQEVTDAADVGFGSFYNHFSSKAELFEVAVGAALEAHASALERALADEADPAVVFASSLRLTGRMSQSHPRMARIMMHSLGAVLTSSQGHAAHAFRDIEAATAAGRFRVDDPAVALACAAGSLAALLHLVEADRALSVAELTDALAFNVLMMFRMEEAEARRIVALPLPEIDDPLD